MGLSGKGHRPFQGTYMTKSAHWRRQSLTLFLERIKSIIMAVPCLGKAIALRKMRGNNRFYQYHSAWLGRICRRCRLKMAASQIIRYIHAGFHFVAT